MKKRKFTCKRCGCETTSLGHLCNPRKVSKKTKLYICAGCGLITTEGHLLCKPESLRLK